MLPSAAAFAAAADALGITDDSQVILHDDNCILMHPFYMYTSAAPAADCTCRG